MSGIRTPKLQEPSLCYLADFFEYYVILVSLHPLYYYRLKRTDDMEMTEEDMESFHRVLDNYLREAFRIQFDQLTLSNIVLPTLSASSSGNVSLILN